MAPSGPASLGPALVEFSLHGTFPDDDISSQHIRVEHLGPALDSLAAAKAKLENDIHAINQETASDVSQWVANAKSLENDINRSRIWANEIVRQAEAPDVSGETIQEAERKLDFLKNELTYNRQLAHALDNIKHVNQLLDKVELARDERRILDSLYLLEGCWAALDGIPVSNTCRVMKLLNIRAFELKSAVHDVFDHVWNALVQIDTSNCKLSIMESRDDEQMSLADAVIGLKAYKEVDQRMAVLWHSLDETLLHQRTSLNLTKISAIKDENSTLSLNGKADNTVFSLYQDLEIFLSYISQRLPEDLVHSLSNVMMPDLIPRITAIWLDSSIPSSLADIDEFQKITEATKSFCDLLKKLKYTGFEDLQEWVENIPRVWLAKCRETALDSIRLKLSQGLGDPKEIEHVETQTLSQEERQNLISNGADHITNEDGWDTWGDDEAAGNSGEKPATNEDDGTDAWGWGDEDGAESKPDRASEPSKANDPPHEEDTAEAWGWGDEVSAEPPAEPAPENSRTASTRETRELTLKETYNISSVPEPVLALILAILEDGAFLLGNEGNPMTAAAAGLFSLPTLVLAMFRAISPHYYGLDDSGNMYLYNDANYLSEQLSKLVSTWKSREDLVPRAKTMLRLDSEVKALQSFANRAYTSEMSIRRTVLRDLLGGSQNLLQQDGLGSLELQSQVDNAISYIRQSARLWSNVLAKSAWSQAVGSLVDAIASKLVTDVMDLVGIGQDDAYNIASLIARITELDDIFLPPGAPKDAIPSTAEYASGWLRLKYLSEVLQSNLQDVRFLWMESELSLYFTVDEVIELIGLSFVDNARTREVVREIQGHPNPRG
ncbi:hypothetical protein F5Y16DRAFT_386431 [Xylariaceae sp. FL0255]|nr:hypothetical protein F5Y16DRAFT_386431 [Xylariaceae sp. FL0255]